MTEKGIKRPVKRYTLSIKTIERLKVLKEETGWPASRIVDFAVARIGKKNIGRLSG